MAWRPALSIIKLRQQIDLRWPLRSRISDGVVGDAAHNSRASDHNPWIKDGAFGVVTAIDITHNPTNGPHARELAEALIASRDQRIKYIISEGQICSSKQQPWVWRKYKGSNGHFHHVHISVMAQKDLYDSEDDWQLDGVESRAVAPSEITNGSGPILRRGSKGAAVVKVQKRLGILTDGTFGLTTERAVKAFQKQKGLPVDGIVGPRTYTALTS